MIYNLFCYHYCLMSYLDDYQFDLPETLIAQTPAQPRDHARLLVYSIKDKTIKDAYFYELPDFIITSTTLVLNNSKVEQCRWLFDDGKTELFVLEKTDSHTVRAMVRPGKRFKLNNIVILNNWLSAVVTAIDSSGIRTLKLSVSHNDQRLKIYEHIPLPPYIKQDDSLANEYQTVYAKPPGSLAAPTAGLHFTNELLDQIKQRWPVAELTLHVGLGTFAKLTDENIKNGKLHEEWYSVSDQTAQILNNATHITAIGTTTLRTLESTVTVNGKNKAGTDKTDIFIRPGYKFKSASSLVTNFHLPSTSLLMLVAAFLADKQGLDELAAITELMRIYRYAIDNKYRFYSFGDAMLLV
jgi:S-adenosylmethionine:tRNA ribosyltransferase-isomerase